jgi:hypothetical protein
MAQIVFLPTVRTLQRQFEELALFTEKTANGDLFFAGLLDGEVEVSFDHTGDWTISDISIVASDGRSTKNGGKLKRVNINADDAPALYWLLLDRLTDVYATIIDEWVAFELAEAA